MMSCASNGRILVALLTLGMSIAVRADTAPAPAGTSPDRLLTLAEQVKSKNQQRFAQIVRTLHQDAARLSPVQRWHLRFLDCEKLTYQGDYGTAEPILRDIIAHAPYPNITARATALLLQSRYLSHDYQEAYTLAYKLMSRLPGINDPLARRQSLSMVVQMLNSGGQHDLALKYAHEVKDSFPSDKGQCEGKLLIAQSLNQNGKLAASSPQVQDTIRFCLSVGEIVLANAMRLDYASMLVDSGRSGQAIAFLNRIAPSVESAGYHFHVASLHMELAEAHEKRGDDAIARKLALQALEENGPERVNFVTQTANKVLFEVEKRAGHADAALSYYEKYVAQEHTSMDDARERAMAFQRVRQDVVANQYRLDALNKQNRILKLKQSLATRAAETDRLYILLLVAALGLIAVWMYRIRHSLARFGRLARHDGLTGAFTRQHFLDQAERSLKTMKRSGIEVCLVLLDMDYFKQVNDRHGHAAGDEVLTRTAALCRQGLRESDIFGRLGGEEFGILMPGCSCETGTRASHRIRAALASTPIVLQGGMRVHVSASFGLACSSRSGYDLEQLISMADDALYRAKRAGRNQLVVEDGYGEVSNRSGS